MFVVVSSLLPVKSHAGHANKLHKPIVTGAAKLKGMPRTEFTLEPGDCISVIDNRIIDESITADECTHVSCRLLLLIA